MSQAIIGGKRGIYCGSDRLITGLCKKCHIDRQEQKTKFPLYLPSRGGEFRDLILIDKLATELLPSQYDAFIANAQLAMKLRKGGGAGAIEKMGKIPPMKRDLAMRIILEAVKANPRMEEGTLDKIADALVGNLREGGTGYVLPGIFLEPFAVGMQESCSSTATFFMQAILSRTLVQVRLGDGTAYMKGITRDTGNMLLFVPKGMQVFSFQAQCGEIESVSNGDNCASGLMPEIQKILTDQQYALRVLRAFDRLEALMPECCQGIGLIKSIGWMLGKKGGISPLFEAASIAEKTPIEHRMDILHLPR